MTAIRVILGPLTTVFTPDPTCSVPVVTCDRPTECVAWNAQTCSFFFTKTFKPIDQTLCWPPYTSGAQTINVPAVGGLGGWGFYSPGLYCPAGQTSACSTTAGGTGDFQFQFQLTNGETAVGCCPSSYTCAKDINTVQTCIKMVTSTEYSGLKCGGLNDYIMLSNYIVPTTLLASQSLSTTINTISNHVMYAPLIQINWQVSNRPAPMTSTTVTVSRVTSSDIANPEEAPAGLSFAAKAGIGTGAALVGLGLIGILAWYLFGWSRKRTLQKYQQTHPNALEINGNQIYEVQDHCHAPAWELQASNGRTEHVSHERYEIE